MKFKLLNLNNLTFFFINLTKPMIAHAISCPSSLANPTPLISTTGSCTHHMHTST